MYIDAHRLYEDDGTPVPFIESPHQSDRFEPRYLVIHYTATLTIRDCVAWFLDAAAKASAHVIVGRNGRIAPMVAFNRRAWHAGRSRWHGVEDLNAHALGIELVNAGALERTPAGAWTDGAGHAVADGQVRIARHKHESVDRGWHEFPPLQIDRALAVARTLHAQYGVEEVLGHDDIAPGRKLDPGPAFPMAPFAFDLLGGTRAVSVAVGDPTGREEHD
ncbi:MAG: N-acetylmuramyl-L-alanine amidase [Acidobacteria bacterium]|nr:MAG: N-acetylmuramyl-L-alanine amidase [Acidobacteriota bacterium]